MKESDIIKSVMNEEAEGHCRFMMYEQYRQKISIDHHHSTVYSNLLDPVARCILRSVFPNILTIRDKI
jgi:hypothetical protein